MMRARSRCPKRWVFRENLVTTVQTRDCALLLDCWNSTVITLGAMTLLVIFGAMVGYIVQRRPSRVTWVVHMVALSGLMIPPAVVPTIWLLQGINLFKTLNGMTLNGMIFIQEAYGMGFTMLLYRSLPARFRASSTRRQSSTGPSLGRSTSRWSCRCSNR